MTLQFSIFGYAIIAFFYIISAAFLFGLWLRRNRYRWVNPVLAVVVPIVLVLPWAEELWIAWNFAKLCEGAGVHVTRKVEVDGFYNDTTTGHSKAGLVTNPQAIEAFEKTGFRYVERRTRPPGKVSHVEKDADGQWVVTILDSPQARYHYRFSDPRQEVPVKWKVEKVEKQILDSETGGVIAKDKVFIRFPNTIEWQWIRFFGTGMNICRGPLNELEKQKRIGQLYKYVFTHKQ